jgi:hypothetical protein
MFSMDCAHNQVNHWPNVDPFQLPYLLDFFSQVCVFGNFVCIYILEINGAAVLIIWTPFIFLGVGIFFLFFLIGIVGGGVQLGPVGTAATIRPIVPVPGDYDDGEIG